MSLIFDWIADGSIAIPTSIVQTLPPSRAIEFVSSITAVVDLVSVDPDSAIS